MKTLLLACAAALLSACGGYLAIDGDDVAYSTEPVNVAVYPHYTLGGEVVYDVHGRYYRHYRGRWVVYRGRPHGIDVHVR
jgi:hypothetical protein